MQFKRWFKDSKVVDADGKPLVVYHGTDAQFSIFDMNQSRANMDIRGAFFSPWKDDARGYGKNVRAFYLSIQNPADEATAYKALKMFQGQNEAGVKARDYLIRQGYDGVNFEDQEYIAFYPEQIKSATDNIGTFDPNNPDIRYSLKRNRQQVNPIREDGAVKDQYQERINQQYTVRSNAEINRDAERMIERFGGVDGVIEAIQADEINPASDTSQRVMQVVLNSDNFKKLDKAKRGKIADVYIKSLGTEIARARATNAGAVNLKVGGNHETLSLPPPTRGYGGRRLRCAPVRGAERRGFIYGAGLGKSKPSRGAPYTL